MAAGMGSRFGGLKQITPVTDKGEIILDFSLYDAMMAGFDKAIFIIKKENEAAFRDLLSERAGKYMDIQYVFQELTDLPEGYSVPPAVRSHGAPPRSGFLPAKLLMALWRSSTCRPIIMVRELSRVFTDSWKMLQTTANIIIAWWATGLKTH